MSINRRYDDYSRAWKASQVDLRIAKHQSTDRMFRVNSVHSLVPDTRRFTEIHRQIAKFSRLPSAFAIGDKNKKRRWESKPVLVFLCLQTREVIVTESTQHPDSAWVCEQTEWFAEQTKDRDKKPEMIIHDRDVKYTKEFTQTVKAAGMKTNPLPKGSPNLNGRCERFIGTIRWECLDKFIIFGKRHLDYVISEFVRYYNTRRAHMERDYLPPIRDVPDKVNTLTMDQIEVKSYVGGPVKSFERKVA